MDTFPTRYPRRRASAQELKLRGRYGVTTRRELLRAIAAEYTEETGERYTAFDAELVLDQMLEAEYQRIEGGAYDVVEVAPPAFDEEAAALLEAVSYGGHNPDANERLRAARATVLVRTETYLVHEGGDTPRHRLCALCVADAGLATDIVRPEPGECDACGYLPPDSEAEREIAKLEARNPEVVGAIISATLWASPQAGPWRILNELRSTYGTDR